MKQAKIKKRDSRNGIKQQQQAKQASKKKRNKKERTEKNTREEGGIRRLREKKIKLHIE